MMKAVDLTAELHFKDIPVLDSVYDLAAAGVIPGGSRNNHAYTQPFVELLSFKHTMTYKLLEKNL